MRVGVLILAGGRASRFGADKRLARLADGRGVLETTVHQVLACGLPCLVCLGQDDKDLADTLAQSGVAVHLCARSAQGMGGTLAEGVAHIPAWDGLLVVLADMPWVTPGTYATIATQLQADNICVPVYNGKRGNPVGFGKHFFAPLTRLGGDAGARGLLQANEDRVVEISVDDPAIHRDIDQPQDLPG